MLHLAAGQEAPELFWKTKTIFFYTNAFTLYNEIRIREQFLSTYCSITRADDGTVSGSMSFSMQGIRAGTLAFTNIAYLLFNPATSSAIQYQSPQSAFSATLAGTIKGYAVGQHAGFFSLYGKQDTLGTPRASGFWIQTHCTSSVVLRFLTAYGNKQTPDTDSWTYGSRTMPSIWSVLGLISQSSVINYALIYGLRRGIDNSLGWFIRAHGNFNFTVATIKADAAFSNGAYHTPNVNELALISLLCKTELFPQSIFSGALWLNHLQKSLAYEPERQYGGSLLYNSFSLKGKVSLELTESQTKHVLNLRSSFEYRPTVVQRQSNTVNQSNQLQIVLETNWRTINTQADLFSIAGLLEYEQFITLSIKIKNQWDTDGYKLYINPKICIPLLAGSITGSCQFYRIPESGMPELQKLELVLILHN